MSRRWVAGVASLLVLVIGTSTVGAEGAGLVVEGLELPVSMAFAPDGRLFVAEQHRGDIRIVKDGQLLARPFAHIDVVDTFEQGLLGIALDPAFPEEPWVYAYLSDRSLGINRLVRLRADGDRARGLETVLDLLPTKAGYHNGGDIAFGTDGALYVTVGEVHDPDRAQDVNDLGGKVLRLAPDGTIPSGNPFGAGNPVYSFGHRNSFGICVDPTTGGLWETENGPSGHDEVNLLRSGGNFGWPRHLGRGGGGLGLVEPVLDFATTIVPTGCVVWDGDLYFGSWADGLVRRLRLPADDPARAEVVASLGAGVTDLAVGPEGALYVAATDGIHRLRGRNPRAIAGAPAAGRRSPVLAWLVGAISLAAILALRVAMDRRSRSAR